MFIILKEPILEPRSDPKLRGRQVGSTRVLLGKRKRECRARPAWTDPLTLNLLLALNNISKNEVSRCADSRTRESDARAVD